MVIPYAPIVALLLAGVFIVLAGLHVFWALRSKQPGGWVIPTTADGNPLFQPSRFATFAVAAALLAATLVVLGGGNVFGRLGPDRWYRVPAWILGAVFAARAFGDFRYVGFFKRVRSTRFARLDSLVYSPLCIVIALGSGYVARSIPGAVAPVDATRIEVSAADVHRFVATWRGGATADSACTGLDDYIRGATRGLRAYRRKFNVDQRALCAAIRESPARYASLTSRLAPLDSAVTRVRDLAAKLLVFAPMTNAPAVFFLVGNGIAAGTTTYGREPMVLIRMELNRSTDGLPNTIAHELVHTQQRYPFWGMMTGGPGFLRGSLLRHAITEGSANAIAELVTGVVHHNEYAEQHEAELWHDFQRDMASADYSRWLYNGRNIAARGERPPDLGYWMGYRISRAYFERAPDKRRAIAEMLTIRDFVEFLRASGYDGSALPSERRRVALQRNQTPARDPAIEASQRP